jgi:hypothetical protein
MMLNEKENEWYLYGFDTVKIKIKIKLTFFSTNDKARKHSWSTKVKERNVNV